VVLIFFLPGGLLRMPYRGLGTRIGRPWVQLKAAA
jgi:hypothetical protein